MRMRYIGDSVHSVIGIGMNVNQQKFSGQLPDAVSMAMLTGTTPMI